MKTIIIAAVDRRGAIGRRGDLLVRLKADMRHFRELTTGHTVIMGRKTFDSLPKGALPNRRNIVVTRNPDFSAPDIITVPSLPHALNVARDAGETEAYIIGGGEIYRAAMPLANELNLTELDLEAPDADTWFPPYDTPDWKETHASPPQQEADITFRYRTLARPASLIP